MMTNDPMIQGNDDVSVGEGMGFSLEWNSQSGRSVLLEFLVRRLGGVGH